MSDKLQIYQMLKMIYPFGRPYLMDAIADPAATWDERLMEALDDLMGQSDPAEISKSMIIIEWNYKMFIRGYLVDKVPAAVITELDKFLDYTP